MERRTETSFIWKEAILGNQLYMVGEAEPRCGRNVGAASLNFFRVYSKNPFGQFRKLVVSFKIGINHIFTNSFYMRFYNPQHLHPSCDSPRSEPQ